MLALLQASLAGYSRDRVPRLSAALAFFVLLSIAPLIVVIVGIVGVVLGPHLAQHQVLAAISAIGTPKVTAILRRLVASVARPESGVLAALVGAVTLLFSSSGVFLQLQDALNSIWGGTQAIPPLGWWALVRNRLLTFLMVLVVGLVVLLFLVANTALSAFGDILRDRIGDVALWLRLLDTLVQIALFTLLFALLFRLLPRIKLPWSEIFWGSLLTAALFALGQYAIGLYFARSSTGSVYGAAGSLLALLLWVYYSAQILYLGAELIWGYSVTAGSRSGEAGAPVPVRSPELAARSPAPVPPGAGAEGRHRRSRWWIWAAGGLLLWLALRRRDRS